VYKTRFISVIEDNGTKEVASKEVEREIRALAKTDYL
jgi:hypothetical protein